MSPWLFRRNEKKREREKWGEMGRQGLCNQQTSPDMAIMAGMQTMQITMSPNTKVHYNGNEAQTNYFGSQLISHDSSQIRQQTNKLKGLCETNNVQFSNTSSLEFCFTNFPLNVYLVHSTSAKFKLF